MKYINEILITLGISLLAYGFNVPWSAYEEAELRRIEAAIKTEEFGCKYGEFARRANLIIGLYNRCIEDGETCDEKTMKGTVLSLEPEARNWAAISNEAMLENKKAVELMVHYGKMKTIWFLIGVVSCLMGIMLLAFGVRNVLSSNGRS